MYWKAYLLLRSIITYFLVIIVGIIFFLPCLILILILPARYRITNKLIFGLLYCCYWGILHALLLPIRVKGAENIPHDGAIFIANHQSALDIPALGYVCGMHPHLWFVLDYYAHKPVLGFVIRRMTATVSRENSAQDARSLIMGIRALTSYKCNVLIFPEGARYKDGAVHEFLGGFALLARKTLKPVLPVFIRNTGAILPPETGSFKAIKPIELIIGPLYYYHTDETDAQFVERIHDWFRQQL